MLNFRVTLRSKPLFALDTSALHHFIDHNRRRAVCIQSLDHAQTAHFVYYGRWKNWELNTITNPIPCVHQRRWNIAHGQITCPDCRGRGDHRQRGNHHIFGGPPWGINLSRRIGQRAKQDALLHRVNDEIDAVLWTAARHSFILPEAERVPAVKKA